PSILFRITINVKCCRVISPRKIYILSLVTFPIGLAIATTWLVFRNNDIIGWPLQSVIGMFIVAVIISSGLIIPSVKVIKEYVSDKFYPISYLLHLLVTFGT
ncbi:unnamed protein product, partial [Schistosoma curassoni]|uniref:Acyl_transf_3 domain-containing protein n=1 Tax=Schistosoma curassoni TaxID=6186 RepID=A0A183JMA6_9TREM